MWQIDNRTPFAAERGWVRDRDGAEVWLVAVKATYDIGRDGVTSIAAEQPPVLRLPEHYGEPGKSSIKYDADLVLTKRTTDILVVGHACVPNAAAAGELDVGFRVGSVKKVLRVFGDREWGRILPTTPRLFERVPLIYERAYGGVDPVSDHPESDWDARNPVGTGYGGATGSRLPNVEYPQQLIVSGSDRPVPAGFGVVASHWKPRAGFAGTYDDRWMKTRQPLLAEDLDDRYFQSAPPDQQAPQFLLGGEPVALHHLTLSGDLRFALPTIHLGFETQFTDGANVIHQSRRLHTVILEPDVPRVSLVFHTALRCHWKVQQLLRTTIRLKKRLNAGKRETGNEALDFD
jgi:hypothetical protein